MAYKVKGTDEYIQKLDKLKDSVEPVAKMAVYDAAGIIYDSVQEALAEVISDEATGDLAASLGIAPIKGTGGLVNTSVSFDGYDRKGTPNVLKARALNSGQSTQPARPFFAKGVQRGREKAKKAMANRVKIEIDKRMKSI